MLRGVGIEEIPDAPIPAQPPRIKIAGIGGGAGNIINRLMSEPLPNTEYIVIDTEKEFLHCSKAHVTLQIDETVTEGFSSASDPAVGQTCALAESEQIAEVLKECDLLFLITCLGGRTGTGAAPVIVRIAQDLEIETHVIAVTPFKFEGTIRSQQAEKAIQSLRSVTDHLTVLSNDEYKTGPNASLAETYTAVNHAVIEEIQKMIE